MPTTKSIKQVEENNFCRICLTSDGTLIKPCKCNSYTHIECQETWNEKNKRIKCEVCKTDFKYEIACVFGFNLFNTYLWILLAPINIFLFYGWVWNEEVGSRNAIFLIITMPIVVLLSSPKVFLETNKQCWMFMSFMTLSVNIIQITGLLLNNLVFIPNNFYYFEEKWSYNVASCMSGCLFWFILCIIIFCIREACTKQKKKLTDY